MRSGSASRSCVQAKRATRDGTARTIAASSMVCSGFSERERPGAIFRTSSGTGTVSSSVSDDGRRTAFGRISSTRCVKIRTTSNSSSMPLSSVHTSMQRAQKRGTDDEAIGRSRGGPSTKINAVVDALGNPLRFILTGGHVHDSKQLEALIEGLDFDKLLADKGYDNNRIRAVIALKGAEAVIPSLSSRSQAIPYDKHTYKERNLVERFFCSIKRFRRIATRYEKTAVSFAAMLCLAGAMVWLK